jgi:hypothetical protein
MQTNDEYENSFVTCAKETLQTVPFAYCLITGGLTTTIITAV